MFFVTKDSAGQDKGRCVEFQHPLSIPFSVELMETFRQLALTGILIFCEIAHSACVYFLIDDFPGVKLHAFRRGRELCLYIHFPLSFRTYQGEPGRLAATTEANSRACNEVIIF